MHRDTHDTVRTKQPVTSANIQSNTNPTTERQHSSIIEKVLAGIPLSDHEIRKVLHGRK
jgi:hypothetical protein